MSRQEFTITGTHIYDRSGPVRWIISHMLRNKLFLFTSIILTVTSMVLSSVIATRTGAAFTVVLAPHPDQGSLLWIAATILVLVIGSGVADLTARLSSQVLGSRLKRDSRDELYLSLLGKSQTFHNRQHVGDIMARAANDMDQLSDMVVPGLDLILESSLALIVPIIFIAVMNPQLLLAPLAFTAVFILAVRRYTHQLNPVSASMRKAFGEMNADLTEAITGIEVVKATAQESQERRKFEERARSYRDFYVRNGMVQARYIPPLLLAITLVGAFVHGILLVSWGQLTVGGLVSYMALMSYLRFPTFISIFTFSLVQLGVAGAERILAIMREESELDVNEHGHTGEMRGEIAFDHVTFGYGDTPVLRDISFHARPGETIAIVGQTGSGKSTLTKLVNRIYDVSDGRVLIDGVDVRDWKLDPLRSQISTIEQDVFLFSRTIAENIAFSLGQQVDQAAVERAAKDAQAHEFILGFKDGYDTVVGERGVTLSGGQRQRIAIARALLTDPRILILDDSTSAIDSATEDEIQKAIRRVLQGRTTLLITHRLSQIRWADRVLVLQQGELIDQGTHDELLARCDLYRRIFARYEPALPSVQPAGAAS
ncbi:MAG: ABC transporter ATP-binding protein [Ktedonobacterales bacterium]